MTILCPLLKFHEVDANGEPLVGGKLWFYKASTTDLQATYSNPEGTTPNTNPVILDSAGRAAVYLKGIYDVLVTDANDVEQYTSLLVDGENNDSPSITPFGEYTTIEQVELPSTSNFIWNSGDFSPTATKIRIKFSQISVDAVSDPANFAIQMRNRFGPLANSVYHGYTKVNSSQVDWNSIFRTSSPTIVANQYIGVCNYPLLSTTGFFYGEVLLEKGANISGNDVWHVSGDGYIRVAGVDTDISSYSGYFISPSPLSSFMIFTDYVDNTFLPGSFISVEQYAQTGIIIGANSGPFNNHYSSVGTNDYTLSVMGNGKKPYILENGMEFNWSPSNTNTDTAITITIVGLLGNLDTFSLVMPDLSNPDIGYLSSSMWYYCHYDVDLGKGIIDLPFKVRTIDILDNAITTPKIEDASITEPKLADDSVSTRTIIDGNVTEPKLADDSVSTRTIQDQSVTEAKLAFGIGALSIVAWCYFDGTATSPITPLKGFNVTNITRASSGKYTVNFTTALPDTSFGALATAGGGPSTQDQNVSVQGAGRTTSSADVWIWDIGSESYKNNNSITVLILNI